MNSNAEQFQGAVTKFKKSFSKRIVDLPDALNILEHLPDIMFFMKDRQGRITACSRNFAIMMGGQCENDILGMDAFATCPKHLAEKYTEDDRMVMEGRMALTNHLELIQSPDREAGWFVTQKSPLCDRDGDVIGLLGITRSVSAARIFLRPYDEFSEIMEYIQSHLDQKIIIPDLARKLHISLNHFERKFKHVFGMSPSMYIVHARVHQAASFLAGTKNSICNIAGEVGFYDQSVLTRYFNKIMGMTPSAYRRSMLE